MLRKKIVGLMLCLCATPVHAGTGLVPVASGSPHEGLTAVAFDQQNGVAVGFGGEVQETQDGGRSWKRLAALTPLGLMGVDVKGNLSIAVGQMGTVAVRQGEGAWRLIDGGTPDRLLAVSVNAKGHAVAVGSFGAIIASADSGATWKPLTPDWARLLPERNEGTQPHLYAVRLDDAGVITLAGEYGTILRSLDSGKTWISLHRGTPGTRIGDASIFAFDFRSDGTAFAVGQDGLLLQSISGGRNWAPVVSGTQALLFGIRSSNDGTVVAAGMYSMIVSRDNGKTWAPISDAHVKSSWYSGVARADGGAYIAVGKAGSIMQLAP